MKFLADMGVSMRTVTWLRQQGHEAIHLREEGLQRLPDDQILAKGKAEDRIVLTFDLDFGYLLAVSKASLPSVVIFRLNDERAENVNQRLAAVLALCESELLAGAVVTVTETRVRVRRLPI